MRQRAKWWLTGLSSAGLACSVILGGPAQTARGAEEEVAPPAEGQLAQSPAVTPYTPIGFSATADLEKRVADLEAAMKKAEERAKPKTEPVQVGSDLSGIAFFKNGEFLNFSTPNKDFTMHLGGWVQWDNRWYNQNAPLKVAQGTNTPNAAYSNPPFRAGNQPGIASGAPQGGMNNGANGTYQDGDYWRRLRIVQEGTFWETGEYRFNWALENVQFSTTGLDEIYVGQNSIPVIGTIRAGHVKNAIGLEGDMNSSSRSMTFMERSSYSQAIELDQNFCTGLQFSNSMLDDHMTYAAVLARPDNGATGDFFGDGQYILQSRVTVLPLYEDHGRHVLHFGISGGFRNGANNLGNASYLGNTITLQSRPEFRADDPAGSQGTPQALPNVNNNRMVSTGALACDSAHLMGLESLYIRGPFSFQAEYGWTWLDNASGILPTSTAAHPVLTPATNYMFNGGYLQVAYTLTGENRAYDKKAGAMSRYYFGGEGPYENAFIVRDVNGGLCTGWGAWEIAARYSYIDLNSGAGATQVRGGIMDGFGLALNWYLNTNLTVNFEWDWNNRYALPAGSIPGDENSFGARMQYSF